MEMRDWQAHLSALECNHHMFENQIHCDVNFRVGSRGQVLGAHRYVLESRSDVFTVMFHGPLAETGIIDVPEVEFDDFKEFLRFLYTDDGPIDADNVLVLLYLAKKYNVDTLVRRCVAFLGDSLCAETACFLMEQGHIFSEEGLRLKALNYICEHARVVLNGPHVHDICNRCLASVFRSDLLRAPEVEVYECALRWAAAECERRGRADSGWDRRTVLGASFSYIRFPLLPARYFLDHVMRYDILTLREKLELTRFFLDSDKYPLQTFSVRPRAFKDPPPLIPKKKAPMHPETGSSSSTAQQQPRGGWQAGEQAQFLAGTVNDVRRRLSARQRGITRGISFAARLSIFESL
ncbi:BTB/POZ domain-containing protein 6-B-like isoform X2 [Pomacea canaliculata]|nr:BTB/POZ domain-containing protein 6-B-like isoform X2 [Pomacea canaliculata]XP_025098176.1 BTB/POZ domain-containing protein 6-B-like isoform X2 [Pomacea canaliculata]XP_025098177.1 BTB/POZ domain-containing protein 6-B-like isoform X2 [Pomacea canaliculata]